MLSISAPAPSWSWRHRSRQSALYLQRTVWSIGQIQNQQLRNKNMIAIIWIIIVNSIILRGEKQEICLTERFRGRCEDHSAIVINSARYGQMHLGSCLEVDVGYLGCQNDVLHLVDMWCSGRQSCDIPVPNDDLNDANTACNARGLSLFLEVEYTCVRVHTPDTSRCSSPSSVDIYANEGYISSYVTLKTGCGSFRAPWIIEASQGQTIDMWLIDFGALRRTDNTLHLTCQQTLGYIIERQLGSNFTICGDSERKKHLYSSKTNRVELMFASTSHESDTAAFMIQYSVIGCSDLTPPAHAWYKREGKEAVIGCKDNDKVWRLSCDGNTWNGVVGNCSTSPDVKGGAEINISLSFSSVIMLTCVVCGAILLIIIVVVSGAVYVRKQSIRHGIKLRSEYACTTLPSAQYFTNKPPEYGVTVTRHNEGQHTIEDHQPLVQIADKTSIRRTPETPMVVLPDDICIKTS